VGLFRLLDWNARSKKSGVDRSGDNDDPLCSFLLNLLSALEEQETLMKMRADNLT
jgi:hypothetical protein